MKIRVKCPAKINLTLEIVNKREDGFHNIKSIMQTISLYDFLNISAIENSENKIILFGNSTEIPYNEKNLVYKATDLFLKETGITGHKITIDIEKNIPIAAGLAGGSTDAAGTLWGLNEIFERPLTINQLHTLCAKLGSDLNVCLQGGCLLATSRGEILKKQNCISSPVTLIKPKNLGISAKEAYTKYSLKKEKPSYNMTEKMSEALQAGRSISSYLYNDLEYAVFDDYPELQYIKEELPDAVMSGSGSTYFILQDKVKKLPKEFQVIEDLCFTPYGVCEE